MPKQAQVILNITANTTQIDTAIQRIQQELGKVSNVKVGGGGSGGSGSSSGGNASKLSEMRAQLSADLALAQAQKNVNAQYRTRARLIGLGKEASTQAYVNEQMGLAKNARLAQQAAQERLRTIRQQEQAQKRASGEQIAALNEEGRLLDKIGRLENARAASMIKWQGNPAVQQRMRERYDSRIAELREAQNRPPSQPRGFFGDFAMGWSKAGGLGSALGTVVKYGLAYKMVEAPINAVNAALDTTKKALVGSGRVWADYEEQMAKAARTMREPGLKTEFLKGAMGRDALDFITQYRARLGEVAKAQYELGSANFSASETMQAYQTPLKLNIALTGEITQTTRFLTQMLKIHGEQMGKNMSTSEKMARISRVVYETWEREQVELSDLSQAYKYVAGNAMIMKLKIEEVIPTLGHLSTLGARGSLGGTSLNQAFVQIARSTKFDTNELAKIEKKVRGFVHTINTELDPKKIKTPFDIIKAIAPAMDKLAKEPGGMMKVSAVLNDIGNVRGGRALAMLVGNTELAVKWMGALADGADAAAGKSDRLAEALNQMQNTPTAQLEIMNNILYTMGVNFVTAAGGGDTFTESLRNINDRLRDLIPTAEAAGVVVKGVLDRILDHKGWGESLAGSTRSMARQNAGDAYWAAKDAGGTHGQAMASGEKVIQRTAERLYKEEFKKTGIAFDKSGKPYMKEAPLSPVARVKYLQDRAGYAQEQYNKFLAQPDIKIYSEMISHPDRELRNIVDQQRTEAKDQKAFDDRVKTIKELLGSDSNYKSTPTGGKHGSKPQITLSGAWATAAQRYGIPAEVMYAIGQIESGMSHRGKGGGVKRSSAGAIGAMQLMPGTARGLGVNPFDESDNIMGGAKYLGQLFKQYGSWELAAIGYNSGPGGVNRYLKNGKLYPETRKYLGRFRQIVSEGKPEIAAGKPLAQIVQESMVARVQEDLKHMGDKYSFYQSTPETAAGMGMRYPRDWYASNLQDMLTGKKYARLPLEAKADIAAKLRGLQKEREQTSDTLEEAGDAKRVRGLDDATRPLVDRRKELDRVTESLAAQEDLYGKSMSITSAMLDNEKAKLANLKEQRKRAADTLKSDQDSLSNAQSVFDIIYGTVSKKDTEATQDELEALSKANTELGKWHDRVGQGEDAINGLDDAIANIADKTIPAFNRALMESPLQKFADDIERTVNLNQRIFGARGQNYEMSDQRKTDLGAQMVASRARIGEISSRFGGLMPTATDADRKALADEQANFKGLVAEYRAIDKRLRADWSTDMGLKTRQTQRSWFRGTPKQMARMQQEQGIDDLKTEMEKLRREFADPMFQPILNEYEKVMTTEKITRPWLDARDKVEGEWTDMFSNVFSEMANGNKDALWSGLGSIVKTMQGQMIQGWVHKNLSGWFDTLATSETGIPKPDASGMSELSASASMSSNSLTTFATQVDLATSALAGLAGVGTAGVPMAGYMGGYSGGVGRQQAQMMGAGIAQGMVKEAGKGGGVSVPTNVKPGKKTGIGKDLAAAFQNYAVGSMFGGAIGGALGYDSESAGLAGGLGYAAGMALGFGPWGAAALGLASIFGFGKKKKKPQNNDPSRSMYGMPAFEWESYLYNMYDKNNSRALAGTMVAQNNNQNVTIKVDGGNPKQVEKAIRTALTGQFGSIAQVQALSGTY